MYSNTAPVPFTFLCKWTARIIPCQVSLKKWHWLFFRGGTEVYIVVYTSENLPRQYKSTVYCIFVAKDLGLICPKPSLKIGTANTICWNSLGLFRDYGLNHILFRNKTFLFFKIESWNFQHLFEKEFCETSQNFNSIRQLMEQMKITIIWMSWMSWHFVRFH